MATEVKIIVFKNFTNEPFTCSWDGNAQTIHAGKEIYTEAWRAEHYAKHLTNKVMHQKGMITTNKVERDVFLAQALPEEKSITAEEALDLKATEDAVEKKKAGRPKKVVEEEEFIGLKK